MECAICKKQIAGDVYSVLSKQHENGGRWISSIRNLAERPQKADEIKEVGKLCCYCVLDVAIKKFTLQSSGKTRLA